MTETKTVPAAAPEGGSHSRPVLHYTASDTWLNDPNGLVYDDGIYHLFYQNNPHGNVWGNMSWGHATSSDLVHWVEHPVAIHCDEEEDIYSGSIVIDHLNTSEFGTPGCPPWIAIYTSAYKDTSPHHGIQAQSLAYSLDRGLTWTKFGGNPVLSRDSADFRDPKVFRYSDPSESHWVMAAVEAVQNTVVFYGSNDLRQWTLLSEFGPMHASGGDWECPDLFPLPLDGIDDYTKWVLTVNINPGAVAGGSGGQYFVGNFDGVRFTAESIVPESPAIDETQARRHLLRRYQWLDWGRDYYAAVSFSNVPDKRRIMIGWMSNWDYANQTPTSPWRSAMTLARQISLATVNGRPQLIQTPVLPDVTPDTRTFETYDLEITDSWTSLPSTPAGSAVVIRAEFLVGTASRVGLVVGTTASEAESQRARNGTVIAYETSTGEITLDRRYSGHTDFHRLFPSCESAPLTLCEGLLVLEIVVDTCSVELFAQDGEITITDLIFPSDSDRALTVFAEDGSATLRKLTVNTIP